MCLSYPIYVLSAIGILFKQSQDYGEASQGSTDAIKKQQEQLLEFSDKAFKTEWLGKKIPIETAIEAYQDGKINFKGPNGIMNFTLFSTKFVKPKSQ